MPLPLAPYGNFIPGLSLPAHGIRMGSSNQTLVIQEKQEVDTTENVSWPGQE